MKKKSDLCDKILTFVKDLKSRNIRVEMIRCDNDPQKKSFDQACKKEVIEIKFEYTDVGTPQQVGYFGSKDKNNL